MTPIKLRMALAQVPALPADTGEAFDTWLAETASVAPRFGFAVDARLEAVAARATFETGALPGGLAARFEDLVAPDELVRLDVALEQTSPARVEDWLESRSGSLERGWRVPAQLPLARALALADATPKVVALAELGETRGIELVRGFGRSLGLSGHAFTEIVAALPGTGERALEIGLEAFRALEVPRLPPALVEAMRGTVRGPLSLRVWLTARGVSHVGLVLRQPATEDVLQLCRASEVDPLGLAAIEGTLGVEGAAEVECAVGALGPTVELEYELG